MHLTRDREKAETALFEHIRKAVNSQETAPKQKHVRGCIVFAWDNQSSGPFWSALKMQPVLSDPVPCFKALVTVHKLLVNGPPVVLAEAVQEIGFLEQCARIHGSQNGAFASSYGYGPLISSYVSFLLTKIEFHRTHPEFTGNFDYEEYLSIKGVQDLDEGYRTIDEMMELQERLDLFQRSVFENFGGAAAGGGVECRVSAFVPLVDESYGMYKFVTSMLSAMHLSVESPDPLILLVERYNKIFWSLREFYAECSKIRYLTSLVAIPQLPSSPPQFSEEALKRFTGSQAFRRATPTAERHTERRADPPRVREAEASRSQTTVVVQLPAPQTAAPPPQPVQPTSALMPMGYMGDAGGVLLHRVHQEVTQMQQSLQLAANQHCADENLVRELRATLGRAEERAADITERYNELATQSRAELDGWKRKYEKCAQLYTELRERFMQLSTKAAEGTRAAQMAAALTTRLQELEGQMRMSEENLLSRTQSLEVALLQIRTLENELETIRAEEAAIGGEIGDALMSEMERAAAQVLHATERLATLRANVSSAHGDVIEAVAALAAAIAALVQAARAVQDAIVAKAGDGPPGVFYKQNSVWTAGLISAAQAVAGATEHLVDATSGVLGTPAVRTPEHLLVAATGVTAATAQLVAAARVKADPTWASAEALEDAARAVAATSRDLVALVTTRVSSLDGDGGDANRTLPRSAQEFKVAEMDQQVEILSLERRLQAARIHLSRLRQSQYAKDGSGGSEASAVGDVAIDVNTTAGAEDDDENALPVDDGWLLSVPPTLEELKL